MSRGGSDSAPDRMQLALLSLQHSRQALRAELMPPDEPPPRRHRAGATARLWWRRLRGWPVTRVASEAARQWWQRHPWQPLGSTLIGEARGQLWPLVRRHPWAAVGLAAALGAATVAARPWRWAWVDRQVRRAPGAASGWLVRQLTSAPVQATLAGLLALVAQRAGAAASAAAPEPEAAPAAAHPLAPDLPGSAQGLQATQAVPAAQPAPPVTTSPVPPLTEAAHVLH